MVASASLRARAFTLFELLLAITVIALLASLLFPTVGMMREQARRIVCLNELRNWGIAILGYRSDHNGTIPAMVLSTELDPSKIWVEEPTGSRSGLMLSSVAPYFGDQPEFTNLPLSAATTMTYPASWRCPAWKPLRPTIYPSGNYWYSLPGYMYYGRSDLFTMPTAQRPFYTERLLDAQRLLMTDWVYYWYNLALVRYNHGRANRCSGQNQLFGDGHGAWHAYTKTEGDSINAGSASVVPMIKNGTSYFYR